MGGEEFVRVRRKQEARILEAIGGVSDCGSLMG